MAFERLIDEHRRTWDIKPVLQAVYADYYHKMRSQCVNGRTLEIGSGSGHMAAFLPDVISLDIQYAPWLSTVADAQALPFADGSFSNIVLLDVLHHLPVPRIFLSEAARVLRPGGRLIMIEPEITPVSFLFLSALHPEPVRLSAEPLSGAPQSNPDPEDANQAIPHLIFRRHGDRLASVIPDLRLRHLSRMSLWAYPLSGGFRSWCLLPAAFVKPLLKLETWLMPLLGPLAAFRLLVVMERKP